ncbi:MAG: right-handed parallel beta-helix repeat-containing protein [Actinobacteria bacterium]|nr:right-handed parallel beta-helix repeat-containing protein [Actinomycetota bacterium]
MADAPAGTRIVVMPGRYRESLVVDRDVELVGGGPRSGVVVEALEGPAMEVRSRSTIRDLQLVGSSGASSPSAVVVDITSASPVLEDCEVVGGIASALLVRGVSSLPLVRNCRAHGSGGVGVLFLDGSSGKIEDCDVYENALAGM